MEASFTVRTSESRGVSVTQQHKVRAGLEEEGQMDRAMNGTVVRREDERNKHPSVSHCPLISC